MDTLCRGAVLRIPGFQAPEGAGLKRKLIAAVITTTFNAKCLVPHVKIPNDRSLAFLSNARPADENIVKSVERR